MAELASMAERLLRIAKELGAMAMVVDSSEHLVRLEELAAELRLIANEESAPLRRVNYRL
jgi:hypothetical protein